MVVPGQQQGALSQAPPAAVAATVATAKNNSSPDFRNNHYDPDHPRSSKRRCSYNNHLGTTTNTADSDNDCYDDVMGANTPPLRNDWFQESLVIGSQHNTAATQQQHHHHHHQQALLSAGLSSEVEALEHQLAQVKRRFEPAADRCVQAVCNNGNTFTTPTPSQEFEQARRACNPYEALGETRPGGLNHGLFLNRSAIKLANIDAILDFSLVSSEHFYFADLCAAPGGFSEYLLRRYCHSLQQQQQQSNINHSTGGCCRGFGMSLVGNNDQGHGTPWKLSQGPLMMGGHGNHGGVYYHICHGEDGTGDIFQWHNVQALQREIAAQQMAHKVRGKVALVTADGGVDAQRNCERQDAQTQKLVVCQVAAALSILQGGGRFIIKLFGCQTTPILKAVMQELYNCFDTLQFLKPISSRPASAERYLVCTGFQGMTCSSSIMSDPQHHVFYGPKWINEILLAGQGLQIDSTLQAFLARVDRDMLKLNLKACFAVLSKMESKAMRLSNGNSNFMMTTGDIDNGDAMMKLEEDDNDNSASDEQWIQQGFQNYQHHRSRTTGKLDVEHYRIGWRLF